MAKPRVFISSTYYDLRYVREDLERLISNMGYEPVRHEVGGIPYSKDAPLEESAYREVALCDIIVCVIGGRYGTGSSTREGSITQNELEVALKKGVQVYVFVEQNVLSEYSLYQANKDLKDIKYPSVDNAAIYEFLEQIYALPQNNPITPFATSQDIWKFLQSQWAGLFQHYLQEQKRLAEVKVLEEMKSVSGTLKELVGFLTIDRRSKDDAIKSILIANHPAFRRFKELTDTNYRVYFTTKTELEKWLRARSFKPIDKAGWDEGSVAEWFNEKSAYYIKLTSDIFDKAGRLIAFTEDEWGDDWLVKRLPEPPSPEEGDDDLPF